MLRTCSNTEIPPKPSKKAVKIMFIEIALIFILAIEAIPFVISRNPVSRGEIKDVGIFIKLNNGIKILASKSTRWLALKIEIITENKTTNPPIIIIVEVAEVILSAIVPPRLEKVIFEDLGETLFRLVALSQEFEVLFQNLKIKPTVRLARRCVINNRNPIVELPNMLIPTVPIMKSGPELFVKLSNLSHSALFNILFFLKFEAIFAPTG
jgi:hypothetical protein